MAWHNLARRARKRCLGLKVHQSIGGTWLYQRILEAWESTGESRGLICLCANHPIGLPGPYAMRAGCRGLA